MLNSDMYFKRQGAANIAGGIRQGLSMGQMIQNKKLMKQKMDMADRQEQERQGIKDIMSKSPGALNRNTISEIAQYSPETAMKLSGAMNRQAERKEEMDYKAKMLAIRRMEAKGKSDLLKKKPSVFKEALTKKSAAAFQKDLDALPGLGGQMEKVDKTIDNLLSFEKNSWQGTGPLAQWTTSNPLVNAEAETLDREFKDLQLDKMKTQFAGMAKAIDSDAERKFFSQSQANIGNRPQTNVSVLLGAKSMAMKNKAETESKREHVRQFGNLEDYKSSIVGRTTTLISPSGKMELIQKSKAKQAKKAGYATIDQHAKRLLRGESSSVPGIKEAQAAGPALMNIDPKIGQELMQLRDRKKKASQQRTTRGAI